MIRKGKEKGKNRKNRKYGQAKLKHSKRGILSCSIAGTVFVLLSGLLALAYISHGTAAPYIGGIGLVSFIGACAGGAIAIKGFKERDKNYLTCKIGVGFNIFLAAGFIAIFCRGLF